MGTCEALVIGVVFAWLLGLPLLPDRTPLHLPIPRREAFARAVATAAAESSAPQYWASVLDVFGTYETAGAIDPSVAGDCPGVPQGTFCKREQGAKTCGPFMVLCSLVPVGSTLVETARIAIRVLERSATACPTFPFGMYAGGQCQSYEVTTFRLGKIREELTHPLPDVP